MRVDPDTCRDPDLLAAEVRRLSAVIDSGSPTLTDEEQEAIAWFAAYSDTPGEERHAAVLETLIARCRVDFDR